MSYWSTPGYGPYNYFQTATTGLAIVAYALVGFSGTMVVPTSACELGTTPAQQGILAAIPFIGLSFYFRYFFIDE